MHGFSGEMVAESALSPLCSDYAKRTGVLLSPRGSSNSPPGQKRQPVSARLFSEGKRQRARREALQAAVIEQQEIASQKMFHVIRSRSPEQETQQLRSTEPPPLPLEVVSQQRRRGGPNKGAVYSPSAAALPASERLHRHAGDALRRRQEAIQADTAAMFTPNTNERRKRERRRRQQQQRQRQRQEEDSNSTGGLGERNRRFVRQQRKAEIHALQERLASPLKRAGGNAQQRERVLLEHAMDMLFQAVYSTDAARAAFRRIDTDGDRCLSRDEFQRALYLIPGLSSLSQEQV